MNGSWSNADMTAMVTRGFLMEDEKSFVKNDPTDYLKQLKPADLKLLQEVKANYGKMSATTLMKHTYINFPFYAIKSEAAENILTKEELEVLRIVKVYHKDLEFTQEVTRNFILVNGKPELLNTSFNFKKDKDGAYFGSFINYGNLECIISAYY
jgi:hypothetical protein